VATDSVDSLLVPFCEAPDGPEAERALSEVLEREVEPVVASILRSRRYFRPADDLHLEDVRSQIRVRIIDRLWSLRSRTGTEAIRDLHSYVASTTFHACDQHIRERKPDRHHFRDRLRRLMGREPLALWKLPDGRWLAGLAVWRGEAPARVAVLGDTPRPAALDAIDFERRPVEFLTRLFDLVGSPVELDDVVNWLTRVEGLAARRAVDSEEIKDLPAPHPDPEAQAVARSFLEKFWQEVCQLPLAQRRVYVLTFEEPHLLIGLTTLRQTAEALDMHSLELSRLWPLLPLDDRAVAEMIERSWQQSLTRQQVINLRQAARQRLARRLPLAERPS